MALTAREFHACEVLLAAARAGVTLEAVRRRSRAFSQFLSRGRKGSCLLRPTGQCRQIASPNFGCDHDLNGWVCWFCSPPSHGGGTCDFCGMPDQMLAVSIQ